MRSSRMLHVFVAFVLCAGFASSWLSRGSEMPARAAVRVDLQSISASGQLTGGGDMTIKVTLSEPAPAVTYVELHSNRPSVVQPPSKIRFDKGTRSMTITVPTRAANQEAKVTITANLGKISKSTIVLIKPPALSNVTMPESESLGVRFNLTIRLNSVAPRGGMDVYLYSSQPSIVNVPAAAHVPGGETGVALRLMTMKPGTVTITGKLNKDSKQATMTVTSERPTSTPLPTKPPLVTRTPSPRPTKLPGITASPTFTIQPPTSTVPASTSTATQTPIIPTASNTVAAPTSTFTPVPATRTPTNTQVPPTSTVTPASANLDSHRDADPASYRFSWPDGELRRKWRKRPGGSLHDLFDFPGRNTDRLGSAQSALADRRSRD